MPRIETIDVNSATGEVLTQLAVARRMFGAVPNLVATAAHSPPTLTAMLSLFSNAARTSVGGAVGELVAIAVAESNGCGYCLAAHTAVGAKYGLPAAALATARQARSSDPRISAILALAVAINRTRGHVSDETLASARAEGLTDTEIVEVVGHVALNVFTNYLNSVAGTTIDFPEVPLAAAA